ncbi:MAG: shikimate kinase [Micromonosporaceae bacterium]
MTARPVVLVGLMGAGKTTVATRVATALGRPLRDSDEDLARWYGQTAAGYARRHGIRALHAAEARQLREALADRPPPVIAPAASVVEDPACRAALAGAFVVWLDAPPEVLAGRAATGTHRPVPGADPVALLADQHARRARWFAEVADLTVDVADTPPERVADLIVAAVRRDAGR